MSDYRTMWTDLGLDLPRHDSLLEALSGFYQQLFLTQKNRPQAMSYFDFVISEVHGLRIQELVEHRRAGGFVIGTFCVYVPDELILALGGIPVGLCAGAQFAVPDAEAYLSRNTCPLVKSAFGFKVNHTCPYFQCCDLVIGETTCDGKKKMYEQLADHHPTYVMDMPQKKNERALAYFTEEVKLLAKRLEELSGRKLEAAALNEANQKVQAKRAALGRLARCRQARPSPISGLDGLLIEQIAFYDDVTRFTGKVNELCDELDQRIQKGEGVAPASTPRVLVSGTPMAIPNWKVHYVIESSGAVVVGEESCVGSRYFEPEMPEHDGTLDGLLRAIATRQLDTHCACFTPNEERAEDVVRLARDAQADAVVHCNLQFCQTYAGEAHRIEAALKKAGIPMLRLETDYSDEDVAQIKMRVEALLEMAA